MSNKILLEGELIILSAETINKLFQRKNGADVVALYLFYHKQCKLQETNQSFTISSFAMRGLKWGDKRFKDAKRVLKELDLVEDICEKDEFGKIKGWYIKLKYLKSSSAENQWFGNTPTGSQKTNAGSSKTVNAGSSKTVNAGDFDAFYSLYPKKINRKTANARYDSALKKGTTHEEIMKGLAKWKRKWETDNTEIQFIKAPDSWIFMEKWNDDIGYDDKPNSDARLIEAKKRLEASPRTPISFN